MLKTALLCLVTILPSDLSSDAAEQWALESIQDFNQQILDFLQALKLRESKLEALKSSEEHLRNIISTLTRSIQLHDSTHEIMKAMRVGKTAPERIKKIEETRQIAIVSREKMLWHIEAQLQKVLKKQRDLEQPKLNLRK